MTSTGIILIAIVVCIVIVYDLRDEGTIFPKGDSYEDNDHYE
jgi:hypothetical protein